MKIEELHIGMKVKHPKYLDGVVKAISEHTAEIRFDDALRTIDPETSELEVAGEQATISGLSMPLGQFIQETVRAGTKASSSCILAIPPSKPKRCRWRFSFTKSS